MFFFFFNDPAPTEIYTLSLHDALPIYKEADATAPAGAYAKSKLAGEEALRSSRVTHLLIRTQWLIGTQGQSRSEDHTSELQSQFHLVCRLLLEKKKEKTNETTIT